MWRDVVIVALLLGAGTFLGQEDWRTRFPARMHPAGNRWVKAARGDDHRVGPAR